MQPVTWKEDLLSQLSRASDTELVQRVQKGPSISPEGREAIGVLYDRYQERIYRYLWMRLGDRQQAEDLTGEVFTRMVASLPRYQDRSLPFEAWLYRIARNLLVDQYRKANANQWVPLDGTKEVFVEEHEFVDSVEDRLLIEEVRRALEHLDTQQKDVIVLRFLIGLPIKEVALILDKSIATIKAIQHRSLRDLRVFLESA